jgi:GT2 family glycosyltransferase
MEEDRGQYDTPRPIFWASGTAVVFRRDVLARTGLLDEVLWMHWEEIDLCWRIHLEGAEIFSVPSSVIYHRSGWTLPPSRLQKLYLNHRNSLFVVIKHSSPRRLLWAFPLRLGMEALTILRGLVRFEWKRSLAAAGALAWVVTHPLTLWRGRRASGRARRVPYREAERRMYGGSVVYQHFVKRVKRASDLAEPREGY